MGTPRDFPPSHVAAPLVVGALWALREAHPEPAALDVYAALLNLVRHEDEERPWSVGVWTPTLMAQTRVKVYRMPEEQPADEADVLSLGWTVATREFFQPDGTLRVTYRYGAPGDRFPSAPIAAPAVRKRQGTYVVACLVILVAAVVIGFSDGMDRGGAAESGDTFLAAPHAIAGARLTRRSPRSRRDTGRGRVVRPLKQGSHMKEDRHTVRPLRAQERTRSLCITCGNQVMLSNGRWEHRQWWPIPAPIVH